MLRPFWQNLIKFNWVFGLVLVLLFGIPRFIIVLNANITGNYSRIAIIFICMGLAPLVFLNKSGRNHIGMKKPASYSWLFFSFLLGAIICILIYAVGMLLYNLSISNWFVYISKSYTVSGIDLRGPNRLIYFLIYSFTAITFSPIGEELFYRGLVHGGFAVDFGEQKASVLDSLAFALTHLAHFGIIYVSGSWRFLLIPGLLWVISMFIASRIFFFCKEKTGSIWGAVISHAAFNLMMVYLIFYKIIE